MSEILTKYYFSLVIRSLLLVSLESNEIRKKNLILIQ